MVRLVSMVLRRSDIDLKDGENYFWVQSTVTLDNLNYTGGKDAGYSDPRADPF